MRHIESKFWFKLIAKLNEFIKNFLSQNPKTFIIRKKTAIGQSLPPPRPPDSMCFFPKMHCQERENLCFFVTFNMITSHIFLEFFIEFPLVVQKIFFLNIRYFYQLSGFFDISLSQKTNDAGIKQVISTFFLTFNLFSIVCLAII